ncbi:hypothetical protein DYB38_009142 [Aphanomyces astaci]|uniref:Uncharacterized protein n=2 Tax=Aphanomyces astaci TaxID=112090 RepID=A0A397CR73_APHAT|nr:hypothetical protein DYB38_009142 [Aphanomyces astaci]
MKHQHIERQGCAASVAAVQCAEFLATRHVRGILCRKFVRVWYRSRLRFVSKIQAVFRGHLSRRVLQSQLQWEHYNVNVIQRWSRGHFGRRRARAARRHMAAERIQCLWRGVQSRQQSDRLWLGAKATTIQRHMRGFLARKHTQCQSQRCHAAAVAMQRLFRGTLARTRIDAMLRDRETHNRKVVMNVLDAEIAWQTAYIDKLQRRLAKSRLEVTVVELEVELHRLHVQINDMECIYIDMSDQRAKMSPRAITDGWLSEMEMKMATQRRMITAAKLDAVFGHGYTFKQHDAKLTDHRDQLARATFRKHQVHEAHRRNVAEQRRKWAVKFYNKSGKVQRHRPAPRVDTTFSMANTNLLATSSATTDSSDDVIANLSDQVKLVTVQSQLAQATEMFTPLLQRFSSTHSAVHQMTRDCKPNPPPLADNFVNQAAAEAQVSSDSVTTMPISPTKSKLKSPTKAQASLLAPPKPPLRSATVPWSLLDQLEAEKVKFKTEQAARKAGFTTNKHRKEVPVPSIS